jgi:hypothetical protein
MEVRGSDSYKLQCKAIRPDRCIVSCGAEFVQAPWQCRIWVVAGADFLRLFFEVTFNVTYHAIVLSSASNI